MSPQARRPSARDAEWFEGIFRRHHGLVRAYVARRLRGEIDDVVAEVFLVAWRKRDELPEHVLPWLYGVASREVLHAVRSSVRTNELASRLAGQTDLVVPDLATELADRVSAEGPVRGALDRLPEGDAEVLRLWAWEHLEPRDIATVLQISGPAARVRLHRARRRFEATLSAQERAQADLGPPEGAQMLPASALVTRKISHD